MSETELREIDRRVAVELGGSYFTIDRPSGWYYHAKGEKVLTALPHYATDPAAADLVRQEIERRTWMWEIGNTLITPKRWTAFVTPTRARLRAYYGESEDSPYIALCLAFLAACEATKGEATA